MVNVSSVSPSITTHSSNAFVYTQCILALRAAPNDASLCGLPLPTSIPALVIGAGLQDPGQSRQEIAWWTLPLNVVDISRLSSFGRQCKSSHKLLQLYAGSSVTAPQPGQFAGCLQGCH